MNFNAYFISDTHFGHSNIIKYCNRPFVTVNDMNKCIINSWNSRVTDKDHVYFLGDFMMGKLNSWPFHQLFGHKHLIVGNHDYEETLKLPWETINHYLDLYPVNKMNVILCHYPLESWDRMGYKKDKSVHLHGHIHSSKTHSSISVKHNRYDVGVDRIGYVPLTIEEIIKDR